MSAPQLLLQDEILSWQLQPLLGREAPGCLSGGSEQSLTEEPETQHTWCSVNSPGPGPCADPLPWASEEIEVCTSEPDRKSVV